MNRYDFYSNIIDHNNNLKHNSPLYGKERDNVKYYKRIGEPGKYTYFYTKEEWDAYNNNQKASADNARGAGNKYQKWLDQQKTKKLVYDEKTQKQKYDNADKNNKYDKNFVEAIQYMDNTSKEKRLEEYKKYLQNPTEYPKEYLNNKLNEYSKGGNVDLTNRPEIDAKLLIDAGYEEAGEGYATLYSSAFSNEDETVTYNFTPIQVDPKTGKFIKVIPLENFEKYCYEVIDGVHDDYLNLQIGDAFIGKDSIDQAVNRGIKIHDMHESLHEINKKSK